MRHPLPFDEEEDDNDQLCDYSIDEKHPRRGNKSEMSNSKSRSRSGLRRYRSKSEDVYERRKHDQQSEELGKVVRSVMQRGGRRKKRVRMRMGSLTKIEG